MAVSEAAWTTGPDGRVHVRVPATSANLGPGFDALGLALDLHDDVEAWITDSGLTIEVTGEGESQNLAEAGEKHLVVQAMRVGFDAFAGRQPSGLALRCTNRIPHGRGLGSSAAAIVAGLLAARALAAQAQAQTQAQTQAQAQAQALSPPDGAPDLLALATGIEGHPDNVAACLAGGLTIAWATPATPPRMVRLDPSPTIRPVLCIAPAEIAVSTEFAREALPSTVPHREAAANAGRAALLIAALTHPEASQELLDATEDWLHQRYRAQAMPDTYALLENLRTHRIPAVVSGAGPSVLALLTSPGLTSSDVLFSGRLLDSLGSIVRETGKAWDISPLDVQRHGARLLHTDASGPRGTATPSLRDTDGCEGMP
ncbi:MAG: homoserine kinase [Streptosporangiaceae bacterium]|nr:homoserine kinase [Streptosporangiaceae bacterium]